MKKLFFGGLVLLLSQQPIASLANTTDVATTPKMLNVSIDKDKKINGHVQFSNSDTMSYGFQISKKDEKNPLLFENRLKFRNLLPINTDFFLNVEDSKKVKNAGLLFSGGVSLGSVANLANSFEININDDKNYYLLTNQTHFFPETFPIEANFTFKTTDDEVVKRKIDVKKSFPVGDYKFELIGIDSYTPLDSEVQSYQSLQAKFEGGKVPLKLMALTERKNEGEPVLKLGLKLENLRYEDFSFGGEYTQTLAPGEEKYFSLKSHLTYSFGNMKISFKPEMNPNGYKTIFTLSGTF